MTGRPFPVDPEVLARIRPMTRADCKRVAELHRAAMGSSLWALLGQTFLERLYEGLVDHPDFYGFVYQEEGVVGGFIAGTTDSSRLFREVLAR
ncbi:MAG TPA: hypothetical protein VNO81_11570, partial [Candidatus Nitrosotenuis sp.]|nr:hypothetical protein [Candidatus Nitrosotenuis sp.]